MKNVAIIMAGGKGERFWPMSRNTMPKQFLTLTDSNLTMIQLTVKRISQIVEKEDIYIVTNESYKTMVYEQLPDIKKENIILEPQRKNTAPCIGLATAIVKKRYGDANIMVLASDHIIQNETLFINHLKLAIECAQNENIVTMGIVPTYVETGYGYIELGQKDEKHPLIYKVNQFVEKPNYELAKKYYESKNYLWNSGMFICKNSVMYESIKEYMPKLFKSIEKIYCAVDTENFAKIVAEEFEKVEAESIDYGVMEKASNIYVLPGNFGWDDVGSFLAIERLNKADENKNIVKGNVVCIHSSQNIIMNQTNRIVATSGLENMVIINTEDALLVINKENIKDIKELIKEIEKKEENKRFL